MADEKKALTQEEIDANPVLKARQALGLRMKDLIKDFNREELTTLISAATVRVREIDFAAEQAPPTDG